MSGTKKSPIEIMRDDLEAMRKKVCNLSTQHQNLSEELKRAHGEHRQRLQTVQQQMEQRAATQQKALALHYTADDDPLGSATWDSMGTFTLTYNSDGTVASGAWS